MIRVHYNVVPYSLESLLKRIDARWDIRENTRHMDHYMNGMLIHAKYDIEQLTVVASHLERFSRRTAEEWDAIPKIFMDGSSHGMPMSKESERIKPSDKVFISSKFTLGEAETILLSLLKTASKSLRTIFSLTASVMTTQPNLIV